MKAILKAILLGYAAVLALVFALVGLVMWWGWMVDAPPWARSAICMFFAFHIGSKIMASRLS